MIDRMRWAVCCCFVVLLLGTSLRAQNPVEVAPVPSRIFTAKKVFIANAGNDAIVWRAFQKAGTLDEPYNSIYSAMKTWGRYELVGDPNDADLVFEIRFGAPLIDADKLPTYLPHLSLVIVDAKSHFILWTMMSPVEGAFRKATWEKNVATGVNGLMEQLKKLTSRQ